MPVLIQLTGSRLSRAYTVAFFGTWGAAAVVISAGGAMYEDSPPPALALTATLVVFVLKTCLTYG